LQRNKLQHSPELEKLTIAGKIRLVPESDLENFTLPQMGRPPKGRAKNKE
jgi:hypothetical protein